MFIRELKDLDAAHEKGKVTDEEYARQRTALMAKYSPSTPAESAGPAAAGEESSAKAPYRNLTPGVPAAKEAAPAQTPAPGKTSEEKLRDLQKLRDGGLISEEEFQAKRKAILEQI